MLYIKQAALDISVHAALSVLLLFAGNETTSKFHCSLSVRFHNEMHFTDGIRRANAKSNVFTNRLSFFKLHSPNFARKITLISDSKTAIYVSPKQQIRRVKSNFLNWLATKMIIVTLGPFKAFKDIHSLGKKKKLLRHIKASVLWHIVKDDFHTTTITTVLLIIFFKSLKSM